MTDRALSTVVGYTLMAGVAAILLTSLALAATGLVDSQDGRTVHAELDVYGERLASDISTADRLAQQGDGTTVNVTSNLPATVSGHRYDITFDGDGTTNTTAITLEADGVDRTVETGVANTTEIEEDGIRGGTVRIFYDPDDDELVIEND